VTDVALLARAGGRYFLVSNMPDLGATPFGLSQPPPVQAALTALSEGFNAGLAFAMADLERRLGGPVHITVFDLFSVQREIIQDPSRFGFTNVSYYCLLDFPALPDCEGYLFFDEVHPTTAAHRIIGQRFAGACPDRGTSCTHPAAAP
jgi:phospholipase/lecithinase/hemolysin